MVMCQESLSLLGQLVILGPKKEKLWHFNKGIFVSYGMIFFLHNDNTKILFLLYCFHKPKLQQLRYELLYSHVLCVALTFAIHLINAYY